MEWIQLITVLLANAGLLMWARSESREDYRHTDSLIKAIHAEMKDFHGRLCALEERRRK